MWLFSESLFISSQKRGRQLGAELPKNLPNIVSWRKKEKTIFLRFSLPLPLQCTRRGKSTLVQCLAFGVFCCQFGCSSCPGSENRRTARLAVAHAELFRSSTASTLGFGSAVRTIFFHLFNDERFAKAAALAHLGWALVLLNLCVVWLNQPSEERGNFCVLVDHHPLGDVCKQCLSSTPDQVDYFFPWNNILLSFHLNSVSELFLS